MDEQEIIIERGRQKRMLKQLELFKTVQHLTDEDMISDQYEEEEEAYIISLDKDGKIEIKDEDGEIVEDAKEV